MVFHEITRGAIDPMIGPREIDDGLVDAAETRRILDRSMATRSPRFSGARSIEGCQQVVCKALRSNSLLAARTHRIHLRRLLVDRSRRRRRRSARLVVVDGTKLLPAKFRC